MEETMNQYPNWVKDAIFYHIFPDRFFRGHRNASNKKYETWGNIPTPNSFFGGNLDGILEKRDYLSKLGVNALYLTPVFEAGSNHKYDTTDYYKIDPQFGSNDSFRAFVEDLHRNQIRLVLDCVFNHSGSAFPPFKDVQAHGIGSKYSDWYRILRYPLEVNPLTYETCGGCTYLPKYNINNPELREELLKIAEFWPQKYGIDGWRLDSTVKIPKNFWKHFYSRVKKISKEAYIVGELWWEPTSWTNKALLDGATNYLLRSLIINFFARKEMDAEDFIIEIDALIERLGEAAYYMFNFLSSHDTPRAITLFQGDVEYLKLSVIFIFCMVGVPVIYYGDEIDLPGQKDPDCRRCMPWDPQNWNQTILDCYTRMAHLRSSLAALRRGGYESLLAIDRLFVFRRYYGDQNIIVVINVGNLAVNINIKTHSDHQYWKNCFTDEVLQAEGNTLRLASVPPVSAKIFIGL